MMKRPTDQLLDDVLGDAAPPDFRDALLARTLYEAERRRHRRQWGRGLLGVAVVVVSLTLWKTRSPQSTVAVTSGPPLLVIVHSRPLDPSMIVETRPGTLATVVSSTESYALVETRTTWQMIPEIDDEGLLALLQGRPVALVRRGPNQAELIFLNPEDEKGFPIQ